MLLAIHITVAIASLIVTALTYFLPTNLKLRLSQVLIALTLITGTYLVFSLNVNLLRVCAMGLIYTAVVTFGIAAARAKLAAEGVKIHDR